MVISSPPDEAQCVIDSPFHSPAVASRFDSYSPDMRRRLLALRSLIFSVAAEIPGVGPLEETLKWGQPAYLTSASRTGTTLRLDADASADGDHALYVNCQTDLVERWRDRFPGLRFSGTRAINLRSTAPLPEDDLAQCISMALTYHVDKNAR